MLKKIKFALRKSKIISRSLLWQLLTIWQSRLEPLRTIYKNEKITAIKAYLRADWEYLKFKKEINQFKTKDGYDFGGIQLPPCVIMPDYFLNVFKPHIEHLSYDRGSIAAFYRKQKTLYPTLVYCKDVCVSGEPKYIGAHITTHGYTYFCDKVIVSKDDVVFDLGSAPGDFAALCVHKGAAKVYAFEPEESAKSDLEKLSTLSNNVIEPVRKYAGLATDTSRNMITIDDFVAQKELSSVHFIKADIEGYEADMLRGAAGVMKMLKPKLMICTYHRENDPDEIEKIILSANETYTIYKQNGVLYAF